MASHQPPSDEGNQQATKVVEQQNEDPNPRKFLKLPFFLVEYDYKMCSSLARASFLLNVDYLVIRFSIFHFGLE